jgi:DNA recombination-dependent growth factor C
MGIIKGTLAVRRFQVRGTPPEGRARLAKGVRAHAFSPIDPQSDEDRSYGWTVFGNPDGVELDADTIWSGEAIALTLRVDTLRPPTSEVKRLAAESLRKLARKPTAKDKREAKALAIRTLRKRAFPATKTMDLVWRPEEGTVLFFATSKAASALLVDLFGKSFGCELEALAPGVVAARELDDDLPESLEPTVELALGFPGLPGRPGADLMEEDVAA